MGMHWISDDYGQVFVVNNVLPHRYHQTTSVLKYKKHKSFNIRVRLEKLYMYSY